MHSYGHFMPPVPVTCTHFARTHTPPTAQRQPALMAEQNCVPISSILDTLWRYQPLTMTRPTLRSYPNRHARPYADTHVPVWGEPAVRDQPGLSQVVLKHRNQRLVGRHSLRLCPTGVSAHGTFHPPTARTTKVPGYDLDSRSCFAEGSASVNTEVPGISVGPRVPPWSTQLLARAA